ncbi:MAG: glycosyltransferase family 39 protein [Candidatus Methanoperedens sp.]|nr:glycosyltransferase family 39 protein [Candidatus Methanoperedens sp.]
MQSRKIRHIRDKEHSGKSSKLSEIIILIVLVSAFLVRIIRIDEHAFVFDEAIYVKIVKDIVANGYDWQSMRMLGTAHPPVYFMLMSFLYKYFYFMNDEAFFRVVTVLISVAITYFIYKLGSEYSPSTGIIASLIFAFNPYFIAYSRFATLDMLTVLFITAGIYFYSKYMSSGKSYLLQTAGIMFGLATFTKIYAGVFLLITIIHLMIKRTKKPLEIVQFTAPYTAVILLISLILGQSIYFPWTILKTSYGWSVGQKIAFNWALITVSTHIGFISFVISMLGLGYLIEKALHEHHRLSAFYVLAFLLNIVIFTVFSGTYFARYLLILTPSVCIFFGYSMDKMIYKIRSYQTGIAAVITIFLVAGLSFDYSSVANGTVYSATLVDDWWYIDSLKDVGKYISNNNTPYYITDNKDLRAGGEFFITNAHYPVLEAYSGIKGAFYMGSSPESIYLYWLGYKNNALGTFPLDAGSEQNATYIVLVDKYTKIDPKDVLYTASISFSWYTDGFLNEYLANYYDYKEKFTDKYNISSYVFKRHTNNTFTRTEKPTIFIGEPADNWTKSNNGWIYGKAWSQAQNKSRLIQNSGYGGMILTIPEPGYNSKLEVTLQDVGYDTLIFDTVRNNMNISIGEIKLKNTKNIIRSEFEVPESLYSDADGKKAGIQQQFLIWKKDNTGSVPVFRASVSKTKPDD